MQQFPCIPFTYGNITKISLQADIPINIIKR